MKKIQIGMIGSGFSARLHGEAYKEIPGVEIVLAGVASTDEQAEAFAGDYGIRQVTKDYRRLLENPDIDMIDICTPPVCHFSMIKDSIEAGKHVLCEKPLTGFFEKEGIPAEHIGQVSKREMFEKVMEEMGELQHLLDRHERQHFFYSENFVYAPAVQKCAEFLRAKGSKILNIKGEESHGGSHAPHAAFWSASGGGSFIRQGCHPLSAALYLKQVEAETRGEEITVRSVIGDMGVVQDCLSEKEKRYIQSRPHDVEDLANVILTFSDGTKASIVSGDMIVGGVRNRMEVFTNEGVYLQNMAPNNGFCAYHMDEFGLEDVYFTEKVETKTGWQSIYINEEIARGYVGELRDFVECIIFGRQPQSDFSLARETMKVVYGAYCSAEEGRRFDF